MSHRAPATIPPDFAPPSAERSISPLTHAFGATDKETSSTIVVHFKVLSDSADDRLAVARMVEAQLKNQRIASRDVTFVITGGDVDSNLTDLGPLEAKITASICKRLGIR